MEKQRTVLLVNIIAQEVRAFLCVNGTEIEPVSGEDSDVFAANSVSWCAGKGKCSVDFGKTTSEL